MYDKESEKEIRGLHNMTVESSLSIFLKQKSEKIMRGVWSEVKGDLMNKKILASFFFADP